MSVCLCMCLGVTVGVSGWQCECIGSNRRNTRRYTWPFSVFLSCYFCECVSWSVTVSVCL